MVAGLVVGLLLVLAGVAVFLGRADVARSIHQWYETIPDRRPRWFWWHPRPSPRQAEMVVVVAAASSGAIGLVAIAAALRSLF